MQVSPKVLLTNYQSVLKHRPPTDCFLRPHVLQESYMVGLKPPLILELLPPLIIELLPAGFEEALLTEKKIMNGCFRGIHNPNLLTTYFFLSPPLFPSSAKRYGT